eukprot:TRINITY_DN27914_c0_g1_i1.p1 TRINITY_DN27914_c0_g1~~TRINITY_DN27914_c0_g1_i1.p1  ORF type:complete len:509 (-),score=145.07 TRINITY_DN27914_c0_g1_i1:372-1898(-)
MASGYVSTDTASASTKATGAPAVDNAAKAERLHAWAKEQGAKRTHSYLDITFEESSSMLRDLQQKGLLNVTDVRDNPEWFFEAHRIVAASGEQLGAGFWTRMTVHFNLFAGTVCAVGNPQQVEVLRTMQQAGDLGCFGLTEKFAGVSSGMVVETIAEFDMKTREFILTSPNEGAYKNWISQGFVADKSVVVADLRIGEKSYGPHAFLTDFRVTKADGTKAVVPGIRLADMGRKTVANDLDNAWIAFDGVRVPESALLDRFSGIDASGTYVAKEKGMHVMAQIGQRLFTGRVAVAQAAVEFGRQVFSKTKAYTDKKQCWAPGGMRPPLSALPQLQSIYQEAEEAYDYCEKYAKICEVELNKVLKQDKVPPADLQTAIAIAKIRCTESVVQLCFRLKQTVGSYALFANSGFESLDGMQIAKFAEGESFVLMQKLVRDRVKSHKEDDKMTSDEKSIVAELRTAKPMEWISKSPKIYLLAELVMDRYMERLVGSPLPAGIGRPHATKPLSRL